MFVPRVGIFLRFGRCVSAPVIVLQVDSIHHGIGLCGAKMAGDGTGVGKRATQVVGGERTHGELKSEV